MSNTWDPNDPRTAAMIQLMLQLSQAGGGAAATLPFDQLSFGYEPTEMQNYAQQGTIPAASPGDDPLEAYKSQANAMQDTADMMMDQALIAGGGAGSYAPDAFAPTVTYEPVSTPTTDLLMMWAQQEQMGGMSTLEGRLAIALLGLSPDGQTMTASQFVNSVAQVWEAGHADGATDEQKAEMESWRPLLQTYLYDDPQTPGVEDSISWPRVAERLYPLEVEYKAEPKPGQSGQVVGPDGEVISQGGTYVVGADGQLLREVVEESELAKQFHEAGYSLPTDQYTAESFMTPEWNQAAELFGAAVPQNAGGLDITESAAQRWLNEQAGVTSRGQLTGQGAAAAAATEAVDVGEPMERPDVEAMDPVGTVAIDLSGIETMSYDQLQGLLDDNLNLPRDQIRQIIAAAENGATTNPDEQDPWVGVAQNARDRLEAILGPSTVSAEAADLYDLAVASAGTAHATPDELNQILDSGTATPDEVEQWMVTNWVGMTPAERTEVRNNIETWQSEQETADISNLSGVPSAYSLDAEGWNRIQQVANDLLNASEIADYDTAQTDQLTTRTLPPFGRADLSRLVSGQPGGRGELAGLNLTGTPQPEPPPDFWTGTGGATPTAAQSIQADRYAPAMTAAMQAMLPTQQGGSLPTYYGPQTPGQGAPPIGDTYLPARPAAQPQAGSAAAQMAMLQSLLPGWMTGNASLPAVLAQAQAGGQRQPAQHIPASPAGPGNAAMSALLRQMMPGGTMPNPGQMGPPSNPTPLPTWMAGATPPSTVQPAQPAGPTQGQGSEALLLAMMRAAQGGMAANAPGSAQGPPMRQTPYSAQNQETAGQTGAGFGPPPASMTGAPPNFYEQGVARQTVGNIGGLFAGDELSTRGRARQGEPRPASKYSTPQLRTGAEGRVNQWLAEDRRIRQLRSQVYGDDYGRAAARAYFLQQRGITPYIVENTNRRGTLANMGLGS
jgi:hypothetical protein